MRRLLPLALGVATLLGCAAPPTHDWLSGLRLREAELPPELSIESPDRFFRARVPAKLAGEIQATQKAYSVSLDIGTHAPVDCWVYFDGIDLAGSLRALSAETFSAISKQLGPVKQRQIERVDAGALGSSPYLALDWMYQLQGSQGPQVGQIKHLVATQDGRGFYCQHNEIGYAKTFRRVVRAFLDQLEYATPGVAEPYFVEISTMSVRDMRVGVQSTTLTREEAGDTRIDSRTSLLIPVTSETLQTSDTFAVEFARPDGSLINQMHIESANGELMSHLKLIPEPGGAWSVQGTFQGKPLATRIESAQRPNSWLGEALALRQTLAARGAGSQIATNRWVPDADPTRILAGTLSIRRQVNREQFAATLNAEGLEAEFVVDRQGTIAGGSMEMGPAAVDFERVYRGGDF